MSWRIPADPVGSGVDHFIPGLAVDRSTGGSSARLALAFYYYPDANCTDTTCRLDVGFVSSTNGGSSWSAKQHLAGPMKVTWLANTSQGFMVGDYISTSSPASETDATPVFASAHAPTGSVFDEAMFTTSGPPATIAGGSLVPDSAPAASTAGAARAMSNLPRSAR